MADRVVSQETCESIIEALNRPDLPIDERRKLTLRAEVLPFRGQQAALLAPLLRTFLERWTRTSLTSRESWANSAK